MKMSRKKEEEIVSIDYKELSECGFDFQYDQGLNENDLEEMGYDRLPDSMAAKMSSVFQFAPQNVALKAQQVIADKNAQEMANGAYKLILKDGVHLAKSKNTLGAYRGALLSNETEQLAGQAEFLKLNPIKMSTTPRIAASIFSVMSMVTSQYYLSDINNNIQHLNSKIEDVKSFLLDEKKAQIWANDQTLTHVFRNIRLIMDNPVERQTVMNQILMIKKDSLSDCCFFDMQIHKKLLRLNPKESKEELEAQIKEIMDYLPEYWRTVLIYEKATLMEIILAEMDDPEYLSSVRDVVLEYRNGYVRAYNDCHKKLYKLIEEAKCLNLNEWTAIFGLATTTAAIFLPGKMKAIAAAGGGGIVANETKKYIAKENLKDQLGEYLSLCRNMDPLDLVREKIGEYEEIMNSPLEFIQCGGSIYFRYLTDSGE